MLSALGNKTAINYGSPINPSSGLNSGLIAWWLSLPNWSGGKTWRGICRNNHLALTNTDWAGPLQRGGFRSVDMEAGSSAYASITDAELTDFPTTQMTICLWAKPESLGNNGLVEKSIHAGSNSFGSFSNSSGILAFYTNPATSGYANHGDTPSGAFVAGESHHYAMVYNGGGADNAARLQIYKDGVSLSLSFTGTIETSMADSTAPLNIGNWLSFSYFYDGLMDDIRIFNRPLSGGDVLEVYRDSLRGYPATLNRIRRPGYDAVAAVGGVFTPYYYHLAS